MDAKQWIDALELEEHPEGGYFRETYRNPSTIQVLDGGGTRHLATSIYFLLKGEQKSHFHQLQSDELWYFHAGTSARVHIFHQGVFTQEVIGTDVMAGEKLQVLLPRHSIFAAEVLDKESYVLMGCMVNPGFDFKDFRLLSQEELAAMYPAHESLIREFTLG